MVQNLGEWGEQRFALLCAEAGVTCNKSQQDKTGWDFIAEFPPVRNFKLPHDKQPTERSARIQIKTSRAIRPSTKLKLTNALRFANDPSPCFVILFIPPTDTSEERVFARHFDNDLIERTLRKAREAASQGRTDLHKIEPAIPFRSGDARSASDLLSWMSAEMPRHPADYASMKAQNVRSAGYGEGFLTGRFTLKAKSIEDILDHQLGLPADVELENFSLADVRFGIPIPFPNFGKVTTANITPNPRPCRVRIRNSTRADIWLEGQIVVPVHFDLPLDKLKFRIEADFLRLLISNGDTGTLNAHLNGDEQCSIDALSRRLAFQAMAQEGPLDIQAFYEGKPIAAFTGNVAVEEKNQWPSRLSEVLCAVEDVTKDFRPKDLRLSSHDVYLSWNSLADFHGLVRGSDLGAKICIEGDFPIDGLNFLLFYGLVSVGEWSFAAVVSRNIIFKDLNSGNLAITCGAPRLLETIIRRGDAESLRAETVALFELAKTSLGSGVLEFCDGDYASMTTLAHEGTGED